MSHDHDRTDDDRTDHDRFDDDASLRALLHSADPAAALGPADPRALAGLVRDVVGSDHSVEAEVRRRHGVGTWLVAAAAAAVVVTAGIGAVHNAMSDDSETVSLPAASTTPSPTAPSSSTGPSTGPSTGTPAPATTVLTISPGAFQARCAVPNATTLQLTDTAFAGTVTSIKGKRITLQRSDTYRGDVADTVVVRAPISDISRLVQTVEFKVGGSYLVSATGGQVALCGFTGPAQPELQGIYAEAFPR